MFKRYALPSFLVSAIAIGWFLFLGPRERPGGAGAESSPQPLASQRDATAARLPLIGEKAPSFVART